MFGYVKPYKQELKIKDYEIFKAYYCGLCRTIRDNFGNIPRLSLNYDMTFMAIMLDSLEEKAGHFYIGRCPLHPLTKKMILKPNAPLVYSSYLNVALTYYKLCDDVQDEKSIKSKLLSSLMKKYNSSFFKNYPQVDNIIKENLALLYQYENKGDLNSLDEYAEPFSRLTGNLLFLYNENLPKENRQLLFRLGYNLGKWIYLIDALDDLEKDMEQDKFNPINNIFNDEGLSFKELYATIHKRIEFSIMCSANGVLECYEKLEKFKNDDLLANIITLGLAERYEQISNKYKDCLL